MLTMKGGGRGLLTNTADLCARRLRSKAVLHAQNGRRIQNKHLKLRVPACRHKARQSHRAARGGRAGA